MARSIYEFPETFRRVHLERPGDIGKEVAFLKKVWERHLTRPVRRVLDIACGDSPHGGILTRDGVEMAGIDRSATMIAAGRRSVPEMRFFRRQIDRFSIPEAPFDAAILMSETFPVLATNRELLTHLQSAGRLLVRGGLYCIDIDRHDGIALVKRRELWRTRTVRIGQMAVKVREFCHPIRWNDAMHSIYELECRFRAAGGEVITRDVIRVRYLTPPIIELAARASGMFKMIAAYADLSFTRPIASCRGRWLAVLRRQ